MATTTIDPTTNLGDDATATFESDPRFIEPTPGSAGSSDNIEEQRDTDDVEDSEEEEDDLEDDDLDEEDDDVDEDDLEDEDEDDLDDEDDEDEEDDAEEVAAAPMRADGLLGYEDEADDVAKDRSVGQGDAIRERAEERDPRPGSLRGTARATDTEEDDDAGDIQPGINEDDLNEDDMDTDRVTAQAHFAAQVMAARNAARQVQP